MCLPSIIYLLCIITILHAIYLMNVSPIRMWTPWGQAFLSLSLFLPPPVTPPHTSPIHPGSSATKELKKYISIFYIFMCVSCTRNRWHTQMGYTEDIHRIFYSGWTFKKTSKGMVRHSDISNSGKQLLLIGLKRQREGMMWLEQCES